MGFGIGIGIGWPNASAGISYAKKLIKAFKERVLSYPTSIFEAGPCLDATLEELNAIGILDNASLVITPNAYNEGILYDVVPNTTLGDMNVVRGTTATRVNEQGLIEVVPRNLLTQSNNFTSIGGWFIIKDGGSTFSQTSNYGISPDGTQNASRLISSIVNGVFSDYNRTVGVTIGNTYTYSIWIKSLSGTPTIKYFNGNGRPSATLTNDWVRYTYTFTAVNSNCFPSIYIDKNFPPSTSYDILTYGAQLEVGSTATEYFPTTNRLNIPRIDYTKGSCPSLLIEPLRTNLVSQSDGNLSTYFSVNTANASSSFNSFVNAIQFPSTGLAIAYKVFSTTAETYTLSVFIKMDDNSVPILSASATTGNVSLIIGNNIATNNLKVESYGNNVYRLSATGIGTSGYSPNGVHRYDTQVLKSFKVTGIQLEAGSYPTSYIPTIATVSRNADVISKTGISSLLNPSEGVFYIEAAALNQLDADSRAFNINDVLGANYVAIQFQADGDLRFDIRSGININRLTLSGLQITVFNKFAISWGPLGIFGYVNGVKYVIPQFQGTIPSIPTILTRISFFRGSSSNIANSYLKEAVVFKTALIDTECIALTTL